MKWLILVSLLLSGCMSNSEFELYKEVLQLGVTVCYSKRGADKTEFYKCIHELFAAGQKPVVKEDK